MRRLPIKGDTLSGVEGLGRFSLRFEQSTSASLDLDGTFEIRVLEHREIYEPPCPDWVRDVLGSFIGAVVQDGNYGRASNLSIRFDDGRELYIPDGPFENWHFRKDGLHIVGGMGRVVYIA